MSTPHSQRKTSTHPAAITSWESVSDWYADYLSKPGNLQSNLIFPNAIKLLAPQNQHSYLDIACGEGAFIKQLLKICPSADYTGIDASPTLIAKAKQRRLRADFQVADAQNVANLLPTHSFHGATCILALQNMANLNLIFSQISRLLQAGGVFVFVINHPCFRQPHQSCWGWDEARKLQYRRIDRYSSTYDVPIKAHPGGTSHITTRSFHRSLETYSQALSQANFYIETIVEWVSDKHSDSGPRARAENIARQEIPLFMACRCLKH